MENEPTFRVNLTLSDSDMSRVINSLRNEAWLLHTRMREAEKLGPYSSFEYSAVLQDEINQLNQLADTFSDCRIND